MERSAYVFFATADWSRRRVGWAQRIRIAWRFPRRSFHWLLSCIVRQVGRSRLGHVSIGTDGAVLDPSIKGDRYWPEIVYVAHYPTLVGCYIVPTPRPLDLDSLTPTGRKPVWPTLLRWWTGGRWRTRDCVCTVVHLLRDAGVDVPPRIYQPQQLHRWLKEQGYDWLDLSGGRLAPDGRRTGPHAE